MKSHDDRADGSVALLTLGGILMAFGIGVGLLLLGGLTLTGMIVLADGGWIGRGVLREVNDAKMRGLPIWHLSDDGTFRDWPLTTLEDCDLDNWLKTARVEVTESTSLRT